MNYCDRSVLIMDKKVQRRKMAISDGLEILRKRLEKDSELKRLYIIEKEKFKLEIESNIYRKRLKLREKNEI